MTTPTTADRLAEALRDFERLLDSMEDRPGCTKWFQRAETEKMRANLASLAQQQATQEALSVERLGDIARGMDRKPYGTGSRFVDAIEFAQAVLRAATHPSPCTAKELSEAECPFLILGDKNAAECVANGHCGCGARGIPGARQQATPTPPQEPSQPDDAFERGRQQGMQQERALWELAATTPPAAPANGEAARDVFAERQRQISAEGWTPDHDDEHLEGDLADAAACYATSFPGSRMPELWPWEVNCWKPKDRRSNLVRAGALILAEIERLDRAARAPAQGGEKG